jgi:signal transduction histidine kinase
MRLQVLETGDLATALGDVLRLLTERTRAKGEMHLRGRARRLAPLTENNVLRIGQEAINNAVKHAGAKHIEVVLEFAGRQLQLTVRDDGRGFNPEQPPASEGGFGLVGIRERAEQMHGQLGVSSSPGAGTTITLTVPLLDEPFRN